MKIFAIGLAFSLAACSSIETSQPEKYDKEKACAEKGGRLEYVMLGTTTCISPTADAGKSCSDGDQCEGSCNAPANAKEGEVVSGTCSAEAGHMGCMNIVRSGKASGVFCVN